MNKKEMLEALKQRFKEVHKNKSDISGETLTILSRAVTAIVMLEDILEVELEEEFIKDCTCK